MSEPFYWEAADGTCGYGWNGSGGSVSGDAYNLTASGETWGEAWVWLTPDLGLSRYAYAGSHVHGWSDYHWQVSDPNNPGSRTITGYVSGSLSGWLEFSGGCLDRTGTCEASASSSCLARCYVKGPVRPGTARGASYGYAWSTSGGYAFNNAWGVTPTVDYVDYWAVVNYWDEIIGGGYEGQFYFTGTLSGSYSSTVYSNSFSVEAEVAGTCQAAGDLVIHDPSFYWGGCDAYADYDSDGFSYVHLEGDIW